MGNLFPKRIIKNILILNAFKTIRTKKKHKKEKNSIYTKVPKINIHQQIFQNQLFKIYLYKETEKKRKKGSYMYIVKIQYIYNSIYIKTTQILHYN